MIDGALNLQDHGLYRYVFELTAQIPSGRVSTYGAIAKALGDPAASRAVDRLVKRSNGRSYLVSIGNRVSLDSLCALVGSLPKDPMRVAHQLCDRVRREAL